MVHPDRIAVLSIHSSPLGRLGTADTGGMSVYVRELAAELGRRGQPVDIFTRAAENGVQALVEYAANVRIVNLAIDGTAGLCRSALLEHLQTYRQEIETFRRTNGLSYRLIHSNYWLSGIVGDELRATWRCPHVITFHTLGRAKAAARADHQESLRRLAEEARLLRCCDGIIAPTALEQQHLREVNGAKTAAVYRIPLGVNQDHFKPTESIDERTHADKKNHPVVLFVGRFDPMKGAEMAIKAVHLLPEKPAAHLVLVGGDGEQSAARQQLEQLVNKLQMSDRVHFQGTVAHQQMPMYYQRAAAVAVSSYYESFGLVILEALATGTPVAATRVGVAPEVIMPGINGYLAAEKNENGLAEAISKSLTLAARGKKEVIRQSVGGYTWPRVAGLMLDAYNDVVSNS